MAQEHRRSPHEPERRGRSAPRTRSTQSRPAPARRRNGGASFALLYVIFVIGISALLACIGWVAANDVLALNKPEKTATITIREEDSFGDVVSMLEENGLIEYQSLFKLFAAFTGGRDKIVAGAFSFLQDLPLGDYHRLEGYLYPDTYEFTTPQNPLYVINKMLVRFDAKLTEELRQQIADSGRTIHEVLTVASLIEKETDGADRADIASVIYNRLNNPNSSAGTNGYLQIDATLAYLNGGKVPTEADKSIDSPYNTYLYPGLPPGPISNPGIESILAAINPNSTSYYYYVLGDDNCHHFFNTYREMQNFMSTQAMYSHS